MEKQMNGKQPKKRYISSILVMPDAVTIKVSKEGWINSVATLRKMK